MAPKKKILTVVKIQLPAGGATPAPPVGTALGPHGVQTMDFVKQYNAATEKQAGAMALAATGTVFNKLWKMNFPVEVGTTTTSPFCNGGSGASPDLIESILYSKPPR